MARRLAARLPHAELNELQDFGHGFFGAELDRAMETLRTKHKAAATRNSTASEKTP